MSIRILIADDHKIIREGLSYLINRQADFDVAGEAENGRSAIQMVHDLLPDVIIMDITMPDLNGIEATRQILTKHPNIKVLALSMHSDRRSIVEMFKAGASGYLLKDCAFEEITQAINAVVANRKYLSPKLSELVINDYILSSEKAKFSAYSILTARELEVLQLLAEGKTTKQIAFHLKISGKTVDTHRQQLMDKLGIHSIAELTKYALRERLTSLD